MKHKETLKKLKLGECFSKNTGVVRFGKQKYKYLRKCGDRDNVYKKTAKETSPSDIVKLESVGETIGR